MEDWPEDESQMTVRGSVADFTRPCLSAIVIPDDSPSTTDSQSDPPSPTTSEWSLVDNDPRQSEEGQLTGIKPSLQSLRHLLHVFHSGPDESSDSQSSLTLEHSSSQSDDTEITVPGSSPDKPIDLSNIEDCVLHSQIGRRRSSVRDPRRRLVPRSTLVGEIEEAVLHTGEIIRPSSTVKLANGMFLRIEWITLREGEIYLWGRQLMGYNNPQWPGFIPQQEHELIWLPWMDHENSCTSTERHVPVSLMEVTSLCEVIFTNVRLGKNGQHMTDSGLPDSRLFCRLKVIERKRPRISTRRNRGLQLSSTPEWDQSVEYLTLEECDEGYGFESYVLRDRYRECHTVPFGEGQIRSTSYPTVSTDDNEDEDNSQFNQDSSRPVVDLTVDPTAYTFGDAYCGAGGTSCGAQQAGLEIKWACDMDPYAVETYGLNFQSVWIDHCPFSDLLTHPKENLRVDIAHCSPPCQTFSPAHTIDCERDDSNSACIFSAWNLVEHATPRILTMEETSGLKERHSPILYRVIMDLIEAGYSVRWTVIDVLHYGVPQTRKRLIIIAAG
jgi:DNA (cytosine-5)-methyltransferase 1